MTTKRTLAIAFTLAAGLAPSVVAGWNETPGSDYAIILQPFKGQPGFWDDARFADSALVHQGYSVERILDTSLDAFPTSRVSDFAEALGNEPGAVVFSTHGGSGEIMVETYALSAQPTMISNYLDYLATGFSQGEIFYYIETNPTEYCGINLTALGIQNRSHGDNSIIFGASCVSGALSNMWGGARCVLGYPNACSYSQTVVDFEDFWRRLDGFEGKPARVASTAVAGTNLTLYKNGATVLAPAVLSVSPAPTSTIGCGVTGSVVFDAEVDQSVPAAEAIVGATNVRVADAEWTAPDRAQFTLHPYNYGPATVRLRAWKLKSALSAGLTLDGNKSPAGSDGVGPAGDDFEWTLAATCKEPDPIAWLDEVEWRGGEVRWCALLETGTRSYRLAGADALGASAWLPASGEIAPTGSGSRYAIRPVEPYAFYRVEELDTLGASPRWNPYLPIASREVEERPARALVERRPSSVYVAAPPGMRAAVESYRAARAALGLQTDVEFRDQAGRELLESLDASRFVGDVSDGGGLIVAPRRVSVWGAAVAPGPQTHVAPGANALAILYPSGLDATGAVSAYATDKRALGWAVGEFSWPSPTLGVVQATIDSLKSSGVDAILLLGAVKDGNSAGTTMPATMEPDTFSNFGDFSIRSETILTLWDFERGTNSPDRVGPWVGYVPLENATEAWTFADKLADYEWNGSFRSNWDNFASWGWDVPHGTNPPFVVVNDVESTAALVPSSWEKTALWGSQVPAGSGWTQMASASLNAGEGIVLGIATASAPDNPCHWLNGGGGIFDAWSDLDANFKTPLFLALSCASAQIDAVDPADLPVVVHELLTVPDRGIVAAIGPTRGFFEHYYGQYARTFWELYDTGLYFFLGDLHRAVRNRLLDAAPGDEMMALFCRQAILVGDPTTTLPGVSLAGVTAVADPLAPSAAGDALWLGPPSPSPFNPSVRLEFLLPRRASPTLRVFDASGRRVATLASGLLDAGRHEVVWRGLDADGREAGSGVYFFQLDLEGRRRVRRGTLLR